MKISHFISAVLIFCQTYAVAQDKSPVKFGKISPGDFNISSPVIDSSTNAVVIADIGSSEFEGNNKGYFSLKFKKFTRIKIINKNGFDAANVEIPLYVDGTDEEKLDNLKAYTYNLEGGKVIETKLESNQVFKDKINKHWTVRKFTMPAVKEGSIIEFSYTVISDYLQNLQAWDFQGDYPRLWSEYEVNIPEYFRYVFMSQGSKMFHINKQSTTGGRWSVTVGAQSAEKSERVDLNGNIITNRWVMKDMPALKEESFTSTVQNHITKVQFQLALTQFPGGTPHLYMSDWTKTAEDLMKSENFGYVLNHPNNFLDDDIRTITKGLSDKLEKAKAIYAYVKNNFTATSGSGLFLSDNLRTVYKTRNGNVADINLLLTAMLKHEDINALPVILSTKSHGYTSELYPILEKFNYVICQATIDNKVYYLDAANHSLGFGLMHWKCYNGHARVIEANQSSPVYFEADELKEQKITTVTIINDEKGNWVGSLVTNPGVYESISIKDDISESGQEAFFKKIKSAYSFDLKMENTGIDSLKKDAMPVSVHYDFDMNVNKDDDIIYFNPLLAEAYKENPFKSADRKYPVEMPYAFDETYVANIETPKGYEIDELPKSARVNFNEDEGLFEYLIGKTDDGIQMRCRIKLNKANFLPEDYESLRDFFSYVVKKQSEQIVYKKKK